MNNPAWETDPAEAFQVTPVLDVPVTVAVNCWVPPDVTLAVVGEMATLMPAIGVTVTVADAFAFTSALLVAVTVTVVFLVTCGAVNIPPSLTLPDDADQVTLVFELPFTVALNCCVLPDATVAVVGETLTVTCCCWPLTIIEERLSPCPDFESETSAVKLNVALTSGVPQTVPVFGFR